MKISNFAETFHIKMEANIVQGTAASYIPADIYISLKQHMIWKNLNKILKNELVKTSKGI